MANRHWMSDTWHANWSMQYQLNLFNIPTQELKGSQIFQIYNTPILSIKYSDIKENGIPLVIEEIKEYYSKSHDLSTIEWDRDSARSVYVRRIYPAKNITDDDLSELTKYLTDFIKNVDTEFKWKKYFNTYWVKPIIAKITFKK